MLCEAHVFIVVIEPYCSQISTDKNFDFIAIIAIGQMGDCKRFQGCLVVPV